MATAKPQKVDFFANAQDLYCYAFASSGLTTVGIQSALENVGIFLTLSQIQYRLRCAEADRKVGQPTQRKLFREGRSPIAQIVVAQIVGNRGVGQKIRDSVVERLEKQVIKDKK
jgi:hypothetical protein